MIYRSKDSCEKHDEDSSEHVDKIHIKQEPVDG